MSTRFFIIFICFLMTAAQTSTDIYLPSFPAMQDALGTSSTNIQLTFALFLIGYALAQLMYGPLSDRYGRKPILICGVSIFCLMSVVCIFSDSILLLLAARLLQGIGCGACSVLPRAIMRDVFDGIELRKANLYQSMAWAVVPIVAPLVGSYIQVYLGWRYNFVVLLLFSIIVFYLSAFMYKETLREKSIGMNVLTVLKDYKGILCDLRFWPYMLCVATTYGFFNAFAVASPILIQDLLGYSVVAYGWVLFSIAVIYIIGTFITKKLAERLDDFAMIRLGVMTILLGVIVLGFSILLSCQSIGFLLLSAILTQLGVAFSFPACAAKAIEPFSGHAGKAAALFGFFTLMLGALSSIVISYFPGTSFIYLFVVFLGNMFLLYLGYAYIIRQRCQVWIEKAA